MVVLIKVKKYLYIALIPFFASMILNFPFPDVNPYGETIVSVFDIPVQSANGINYVGITSLLLLILSLYLLVKSLKKYHFRLVITAIMLAIFTPTFVASSFQKTFATGIYAISYELDDSKCSFEKTNETTLHGVCELPFKNYSKNDVQFTIEFYKRYSFEDEIPMVSLMNNNAPYRVKLGGNGTKRVIIETNIDISKMENQIDGGEATDVNIIIKSGRSSRKL